MKNEIFVYINLSGKNYFVGTLWINEKKGQEKAVFEYSKKWLENPISMSLEPALTLGEGKFFTDKALFGSIGDSAPDRWGRMLMDRMEIKRAKNENRSPKKLLESDYLLMVDDKARQGALRFSKDEQGPFLANYSRSSIPPLVNLKKILSLTDKVITKEENNQELQDIFEPGSSLGGARPKATVKDGNTLLIAKFPSPKEDYDIELWEYIALKLAKEAGLNVPDFSLHNVSGKNVLLLNRFDRFGYNRTPFLSAMSMLGMSDGDKASYLEIAEALMIYGHKPECDLQELWKRIVFNLLVSNFDDHLRNHGFLYNPQNNGWELSPLYDLEPLPLEKKPRFLQTSIDLENNDASLDLAFEVCEEFGFSLDDAKDAAKNLAESTRNWLYEAKKLNINSQEIEFIKSAFEHEDFDKAIKRTIISPVF